MTTEVDSQHAFREAITSIATAISGGLGHPDAQVSHEARDDLEAKVARLGLWPRETWALQHFPLELHQFCGHGLGLWQYPVQIAPLLRLLYRYEVNSYLEIGVAAGGTFRLISELLNEWSSGETFRAVACDPAPPGCISYSSDGHYREGFQQWLVSFPQATYIQEFSERLEKTWPQKGTGDMTFDCVFIDGDHSFEGCWNDFELALRMNARIMILHDIVNDECPGVCEAWRLVKEKFADEFEFHEFVGQYEEVQRTQGHDLLGIGACVRKSTPLRTVD